MTRVTLRCDVSWIEREPSRGGYERNHLSMFSAICFLSYEATIYDAGHHNFEWCLIARESTIFFEASFM